MFVLAMAPFFIIILGMLLFLSISLVYGGLVIVLNLTSLLILLARALILGSTFVSGGSTHPAEKGGPQILCFFIFSSHICIALVLLLSIALRLVHV
jgi:hypothetical protein